MAVVPNIPTDYNTLMADVLDGDVMAAQLLASKSGKTPFDGAVLACLVKIASKLNA